MDTLEMDSFDNEAPLSNEINEANEGETSDPSLLTRERTSQGRDAEGNDDQSAFVPERPEEYNLSFGKDIQVDEELLTNFSSVAHEMGLQKGQAQKLADLYVAHTEQATRTAHEAQVASLMQAKKGWEREIESRPHFQQEVTDARRTLKEFGSPELNEIMDSSLLGSHPVFFDFVVKVGKALAEPEVRGRSASGQREKPLMDRLWPSMK